MGPKGGAKQRFLKEQGGRHRSRSRTDEAASSSGPATRGGVRERVLKARDLQHNNVDEEVYVSNRTANNDPV